MKKIKGGYYLKAKKVQESWIAKAPPHVREIWDLFLRKAFYKDGIDLKRGQLLITYSEIIEELAWFIGYRKMTYKKHHCEIAMKALLKHAMITTTKTTRGVIVTILNYDKYQSVENYECYTRQTVNTTGTLQSNDTIEKEVKEVKEVKTTTGEKSPEPPSPKKKVFDPQTIRPDWISEQDWTDIITHRKKHHRRPIQTERAYRGMISQLQKAIDAGYTLEECLDKWLNNSSWQTFKLEYIQNTFCPMPNRKTQKATQNQQYAIELLKEM